MPEYLANRERANIEGQTIVVKAVVHPASESSAADLLAVLAQEGISTYTCTSRAEAGPALLMLGSADDEAMERCVALSRNGCDRLLVVWTAQERLEERSKWRLLHHGATDVVEVRSPSGVRDAAARLRRWSDVERIIDSSLIVNNLVGTSRAWRRALRELVEVGRFTNASLLITGETGTGKELAAKLVHTLDARSKKGDLVVLDCTTVVPSLSGSEFFGHERGAFTGATGAREGVFALANGGTLFLDEIGELPIALQAELLRAIQEGAFKPVGSNAWKQANFRLVCATNRELRSAQQEGEFRTDLYHRIACWRVELPSLRERRSDILPLFLHFAERLGRPGLLLDESVAHYLLTRSYPGNVRELKQLTERMCLKHAGEGAMTVGAIPEQERPRDEPHAWQDAAFRAAIERAVCSEVGLRAIRKVAEDAAVDCAIELEAGNLQRAAVKLGVTARAIQMRLAGRRSDSDPPGMAELSEAGAPAERCA